MKLLFLRPSYIGTKKKGSLVAKYENSRNELLVHHDMAIFLIKEGEVKKEIAGIAQGSNDFSGCVYAKVSDNPYLVSVDK